VLMFGILSLQLARMQLVNGEKYERRAQTNRLRLETLLPSRGLIYDSAGRPLVENVPSYAAAVVAADIPEGEETTISIHLQELTGIPAGQIVDKIMERQESNDPFTPAIIKDNPTKKPPSDCVKSWRSYPACVWSWSRSDVTWKARCSRTSWASSGPCTRRTTQPSRLRAIS
jgi:cell division protein FtsI/penicillin-binding protein 2